MFARLLARMRSGRARIARIEADIHAATPAPAPVAPPAPQPTAHPAAQPAVKPPPGRLVLVHVLGLHGPTLAGVVKTVTTECRANGTRPLFVTDQRDFAVFRANRVLFEHVVDAELLPERWPDLDWQDYQARQYRLIGRKWRPTTNVSFGRAPHPACIEALLAGAGEKL